MSIFELTAALNHHKIQHMVESGRVLITGNSDRQIDITGWTRIQLAQWLGY